MSAPIDLTGKVFGRLTAKSVIVGAGKKRRWACGCSCGKHTEVITASLIDGHIRSCGCAQRDAVKKYLRRRWQTDNRWGAGNPSHVMDSEFDDG